LLFLPTSTGADGKYCSGHQNSKQQAPFDVRIHETSSRAKPEMIYMGTHTNQDEAVFPPITQRGRAAPKKINRRKQSNQRWYCIQDFFALCKLCLLRFLRVENLYFFYND
jgi:hypothetical protein